jgi:hypothetical protein
VHELERVVEISVDDTSTRDARTELYRLYGETFRAHKLEGIVMAASSA